MRDVAWARIATPIGELRLVGGDDGLREIRFADDARALDPAWAEAPERFRRAAREIAEYFSGERRVFDLVLEPAGTPFQRRVWDELRRIPYGSTIPYAELARRVGVPNAPRAAGAANGRNPLPIVVPCHRVVGTDGGLTGYAGGLAAKRRLLELEGAAPASSPAARQRFAATRSP